MKREQQIKKYLSELNNISILPKANVLYANIYLLEFKTHYKNGNLFKHINGSIYAIAVFNAITQDSAEKISLFLKTPNFDLNELKKIVDTLKLIKYIGEGTKAYTNWETGDIGNAFLVYDKIKHKHKIRNFANHTSLNRGFPLRKRPSEYIEIIEEDNFQIEEDAIDSFNNDFYNDQLDLDQQNQEFWDEI